MNDALFAVLLPGGLVEIPDACPRCGTGLILASQDWRYDVERLTGTRMLLGDGPLVSYKCGGSILHKRRSGGRGFRKWPCRGMSNRQVAALAMSEEAADGE